jgi:ABC-type uncharacterized transport system permease subunit
MPATIFSMTAIVLYLAATWRVALPVWRQGLAGLEHRNAGLVLGVIAIMCHGAYLYLSLFTGSGINLGVFNAASLVAWLVVVLMTIMAFGNSLEHLAGLLLPLAALSLGAELLFTSHRIIPESAPLALQAHVLLSVLAYSLLTIGTILALALAFEHRQLRSRRPLWVMRLLPPMQVLESLLFHILTIGFFFLSLSLLSGLMFLKDIFAQHLLHKTVLSILAWLVFGVLLLGRWHYGWRGRKAIRWTLWGSGVLLLAYFGTKVVLELILKRV